VQVLVQVLHGVTDVDPVARDTADSYRLGRLAQLRYLVWPTALPFAVTGSGCDLGRVDPDSPANS